MAGPTSPRRRQTEPDRGWGKEKVVKWKGPGRESPRQVPKAASTRRPSPASGGSGTKAEARRRVMPKIEARQNAGFERGMRRDGAEAARRTIPAPTPGGRRTVSPAAKLRRALPTGKGIAEAAAKNPDAVRRGMERIEDRRPKGRKKSDPRSERAQAVLAEVRRRKAERERERRRRKARD